jgi:DNA-binding transcriptional LysR family regulator
MRTPHLEPNDLLLFARVADLGSFSRAAERLGVPKSTVSRRVSTLEAQLGERLLLRTTRKLTVTDFGQAVLEHARHVAEDVEAATSLAQNRQVAPSGLLRVTMPGDLANLVLGPMLSRFAMEHPAITLELDLSSRFVDLIGESFDVAIRMGPLRDDASLAARRIATFSIGLYAARAYLDRRGTPRVPADLVEHDVLQILSRTGSTMPWELRHGSDRWEGLPRTRAIANSPEMLMRMALKGLGITRVNDHFALPYVKSGELVPVLPRWRPAPVDAWAVFPGRRLMPAKTRAFVDALVAAFSGPECDAVHKQSVQSSAKRTARVTGRLQRQPARTRSK